MAKDQETFLYLAIGVVTLFILALVSFGEAFEFLAQATAAFAEGLTFILLAIVLIAAFILTRKR